MIQIKQATKKEVQMFGKKEWPKLDVMHYGKPNIKWVTKEFKYKIIKEGVIAGIITGKVHGRVVYIDELLIAESERGTGLGKQLIDIVTALGKKYRCHKLYLITGKDWPSNIFYLKQGFVKTADLPDHHLHHDFVAYQKKI